MGIARTRIGRVTKNTLKQEIGKQVRAIARMTGETHKQVRQDLKDMDEYFFPKKSRFRR